jgi:hypothetical protein
MVEPPREEAKREEEAVEAAAEQKERRRNQPPRERRMALTAMLPESLRGEIVPLNCADKKIDDRWEEGQDLAAFPQPYRALLLGPPNCGKSTLAKHMLIHADPPFDELIVIHEDYQPDGGGSTEWDDADPTLVMGEPPDLAWWDAHVAEDDPDEAPVRRLVVIDDLESTGVSKQRQRNLATLFRYCSSHLGMSLILCFQNMFGLPPILRKMANVIICWRPVARNEVGLIANRVGLTAEDLMLLFRTAEHHFGRSTRHSLCFDSTTDTPAPIRVNLFWPMRLE